MEHVSLLRSIEDDGLVEKRLLVRATGRFYTHPTIGRYLAAAIFTELAKELVPSQTVRVVDPFAGDGRLALWLVERAISAGRADISWEIALWDLDATGLEAAKHAFVGLQHRASARVDVTVRTQDTFREALAHRERYDVVVTNPPWDLLKPDHRELVALGEGAKEAYVSALRRYEEFLRRQYPLSRPNRRFAGWGTQLSRVGVEVCLRLVRGEGIVGLVTPSSLLADDASVALRRRMIAGFSLKEVGYFPAEAKLFGSADVTSAALLLKASEPRDIRPTLRRFDSSGKRASTRILELERATLEQMGYSIPVAFGGHIAYFDTLVRRLPTFGDLERAGSGFKAGRELDETGIAAKLAEDGLGPFVKGRMIQRFLVTEQPTAFVRQGAMRKLLSLSFQRIA